MGVGTVDPVTATAPELVALPDVDAAVPCTTDRCTTPPRTADLLVWMRCPGCGQVWRRAACSPCYDGWTAAVNSAHGLTRHRVCGWTGPLAECVVRVDPL